MADLADLEDDWDDDDDWDDVDDLRYVKEEPDCYACNDSGLRDYDSGKPCKACCPSRLAVRWWGLRYRWRLWRRLRRPCDPEEAPF